MTYATLMVNLEPGHSNAAVLRLTNLLAKRFDAAVIGIAARQPMQILYTEGDYVAPDIIQEERDQIDKEIDAAEAEFRSLVEVASGQLSWRSTVSYEAPSDYVARQARSADLVLTGMPPRSRVDATRVATGELVMQASRPVLVAPVSTDISRLDRVVLAWRDTREARRAALDALPLLRGATSVSVVEVAAEEDMAEARFRLADVAHWLARHGIAADTLVEPAGDDEAQQLDAVARARGAELIVAGAYGHSRVREWAFGGVTRNLLLRGDRCSFLSH